MEENRLKRRLSEMMLRFQTVEELLGRPDVIHNQSQYRELAQEHAYLSDVKEIIEKMDHQSKQLSENEALLKSESDLEIVQMIREDNAALLSSLQILKVQLETLLVPPDPLDNRNVIIEIRAGTGGDEAAIFVGDCVRMYKCYAETKGWKYEALAAAPSERGGYKEYVMVVSGHQVFRLLRYEAGTHRVQRVPETEAQGRVHTSAITIAVLPEPTDEETLQINPAELRIDTYRSSGAGGQHVNTTDSAVRITHIPTGTVVTCQDERSQIKNREKAMRLLGAKIIEEKRRKEEEELASLRSSQVGSGDRSERIRTYNFSQNRVTDHRINLTLYNLTDVLDGKLDDFTQALVAYFYEQKLAGDENGS